MKNFVFFITAFSISLWTSSCNDDSEIITNQHSNTELRQNGCGPEDDINCSTSTITHNGSIGTCLYEISVVVTQCPNPANSGIEFFFDEGDMVLQILPNPNVPTQCSVTPSLIDQIFEETIQNYMNLNSNDLPSCSSGNFVVATNLVQTDCVRMCQSIAPDGISLTTLQGCTTLSGCCIERIEWCLGPEGTAIGGTPERIPGPICQGIQKGGCSYPQLHTQQTTTECFSRCD